MRIDKFLKNSRIIKRRSLAKLACESGRVKINDSVAKAGTKVNVGDKVSVEFGDRTINFEVLDLIDNSNKSNADNMFRVIEG